MRATRCMAYLLIVSSCESNSIHTDLRPVSQKSRNFSGDKNLFVPSIGTRFVLWNFAVILSFLLSETYQKSEVSRQTDHGFKNSFSSPIRYRVFRETALWSFQDRCLFNERQPLTLNSLSTRPIRNTLKTLATLRIDGENPPVAWSTDRSITMSTIDKITINKSNRFQ